MKNKETTNWYVITGGPSTGKTTLINMLKEEGYNTTIEQDHPELYQYLDENPVTIPNIEHPNIDTRTMSDWLESLKELWKKNIENQI